MGGLWGVDYNRGEKTTFTTSIQNRDTGREVHLEDPVRESHSESNGNVTTREYDPVYDVSQRPKQLVAGIQIELLVALIIGLLVVCVVCIGLLYNCLRRRAPVKDLELSHSKYDGRGTMRMRRKRRVVMMRRRVMRKTELMWMSLRTVVVTQKSMTI